MLSYKMDFSSCDIMPDFGKSSHIYANEMMQDYEVVGSRAGIDFVHAQEVAMIL